MPDIRVNLSSDFEAALAKTAKMGDGKTLNRQLRKELSRAARPALADAKRTVRSLPVAGVRGGGSAQRRAANIARAGSDKAKASAAKRKSGLRASVAAATSIVLRARGAGAGLSIVVRGEKMPAGQRTLPRHLDNPAGWRHPVFGRNVWSKQYGRPWFATTIRKHAGGIRAGLSKAISQYLDGR